MKANPACIALPPARLIVALALAASAVLAACGGGGGDSTPAPTPAGANLGVTFVTVPAPNVATGYGATNSELAYVVQLANTGTVAAPGAVITVPAPSGATLETVACGTELGGATCPAGLTLAALAAGTPFNLPAGASLRLTLTGVATATTGSAVAVTTTATVPAGVADTDGSNNSRTASFTVIAPIPGTLVTSVPAPVYTDVSKVAAFNYLNGVRGRCGFGLLKQDTRLDQAADDHTNYLVLNDEFSHTQTPGKPGFTGVGPTERAIYRGYPGDVGEGLVTSTPPNSLAAQFQLLVTTYYGAMELGGAIDMGLGSHLWVDPTTGGRWNYEAVSLGALAAVPGQRLASSEVATYPCDGEVGRYRNHWAETPNPIPGADLRDYGAPVLARARSGSVLRIDAWTLVPRGGAPLATTLLTSVNDPNQNLSVNEAALIPNVVLGHSEVYDVVLRGAVSGVRFERHWSFTSGTCDRRASRPTTCPWTWEPPSILTDGVLASGNR